MRVIRCVGINEFAAFFKVNQGFANAGEAGKAGNRHLWLEEDAFDLVVLLGLANGFFQIIKPQYFLWVQLEAGGLNIVGQLRNGLIEFEV